jgi:hypothetical protein
MTSRGAARISGLGAAWVKAGSRRVVNCAKAQKLVALYALMAVQRFLCATHKIVDSGKKRADITKL